MSGNSLSNHIQQQQHDSENKLSKNESVNQTAKKRRNRRRSRRTRNDSMASNSGQIDWTADTKDRNYGYRYERNDHNYQRSRYEKNDNRDNRFDARDKRHSGHSNQYYRQRTESNVSARSAVSGLSTDNNSRRGSFVGSDYRQRTGQQRQLRWDRDRLSREIWEYYENHCQTKDTLTRKNRLKDALHKILSSHFTDYEVNLYIVGSTANGLANNDSDVDICIVMNEINKASEEEKDKESDTKGEQLVNLETTETKPVSEPPEVDENEKLRTEVDALVIDESDSVNDSFEESTASNGKSDPSIPMLEKIEEVLKNYNFVTRMQIILAKVPILKFNDRISGIEVTLNVNKLVSIRNTLLIHDYTELDWRVQPLMLVIKAWAKDHNIKDAYNRSISSYSLVLMVIHYLQYACDPPVLPSLQKLDPKRYDPEADIRSIRLESKPKRWKSHNESSLKELMIGFLDYYSYNFCFSKDAISVRLGQPIPKHLVQHYRSDENAYSHWKYMSIEEPFNRTNTARSVYDSVMFEHILNVFRVSHYTLRRYPFLDSIMAGKQFSNQYVTTTPRDTTVPLQDSYIESRKSPQRRSRSSSINQ